jgi:hypothetical protein
LSIEVTSSLFFFKKEAKLASFSYSSKERRIAIGAPSCENFYYVVFGGYGGFQQPWLLAPQE